MQEQPNTGAPCVIRIVSYAEGHGPSPFDGQYLVDYDVERDGDRPGAAFVVASPDITEARVFESTSEAAQAWTSASQTTPLRADGQANRPLTAYTVEIIKAPEGNTP